MEELKTGLGLFAIFAVSAWYPPFMLIFIAWIIGRNMGAWR